MAQPRQFAAPALRPPRYCRCRCWVVAAAGKGRSGRPGRRGLPGIRYPGGGAQLETHFFFSTVVEVISATAWFIAVGTLRLDHPHAIGRRAGSILVIAPFITGRAAAVVRGPDTALDRAMHMSRDRGSTATAHGFSPTQSARSPPAGALLRFPDGRAGRYGEPLRQAPGSVPRDAAAGFRSRFPP